MNIWKASTIGLAAALTIVIGKDGLTKAAAAPGGSDRPSAIAFDWGVEQPHMQKALEDLKAARHSLELAAELLVDGGRLVELGLQVVARRRELAQFAVAVLCLGLGGGELLVCLGQVFDIISRLDQFSLHRLEPGSVGCGLDIDTECRISVGHGA